jgi:nitroimidazol reductase NimA-like FMN-containing flavoprotein (pyridoxamine 5'-phosphate oxidase superfamily)
VALTMTSAEREEFLAGLHVGILSVDDPGRAPLTIPVWYAYAPGGTVNVITGGQSVKAQRLRAAGRFSLCAQTETVPYRYVSVEGPITAIDDAVAADERRAMATRYLGAEGAELYLAATAAEAAASIAVRMSPARWRTVDYGKQLG